jgi:hypothetical protein
MFVITRTSAPSEAEVEEGIVRLCRLAADLHEVRNAVGPSEDALRDAPILENWRLAARSTHAWSARSPATRGSRGRDGAS